MIKTYDEIVEILKKKNFQKRIDSLVKKYKGKEIIVYGAGIAFDAIRKNFDISSLNIAALADIKFKDDEEYEGYRTLSPESIASENPDIVLISMYDSDVAKDFFDEDLFPSCGNFKYESFIKFSFFDLLKELFS